MALRPIRRRNIRRKQFLMQSCVLFLLLLLYATSQYSLLHQVSQRLYSPTINSSDNEMIEYYNSQSALHYNRVMFFCYCAEENSNVISSFISALSKISELTPIATHPIKVQTAKDHGPGSGVICEDEIDKLIAEVEQGSSSSDGGHSLRFYVEVFYAQRFDTECHRRRNIQITTKVVSQQKSSWTGGAHLVPYPQQVNTRNLNDWGEVFHTKSKTCNTADTNTLHIYRSKGISEKQNEGCNMIHIPTIIRWANDIHTKRSRDIVTNNETLKEMLTHCLTYEEAKAELKSKTAFCGLVTLTTWKDMYPIDALVRHALCRLLTKQYKPCDALAAWKGALKGYPKTSPSDTYKIQKNHKFIISMANEFTDGYLVEKMIHPYLASSIAISASPNLGNYINDKRPVLCSVPRKDLEYVNKWKTDGGKAFMPFNATPEHWENDRSIKPIPFKLENDEPLLEFIADAWKNALQPCIDEIIRLDKDDESYIAKLMEPFVTHFEYGLFDGTYVGLAVLNWLSHVDSPVTFGLEGIIQKLEKIMNITQ